MAANRVPPVARPAREKMDASPLDESTIGLQEDVSTSNDGLKKLAAPIPETMSTDCASSDTQTPVGEPLAMAESAASETSTFVLSHEQIESGLSVWLKDMPARMSIFALKQTVPNTGVRISSGNASAASRTSTRSSVQESSTSHGFVDGHRLVEINGKKVKNARHSLILISEAKAKNEEVVCKVENCDWNQAELSWRPTATNRGSISWRPTAKSHSPDDKKEDDQDGATLCCCCILGGVAL